jgi:hypothetical protein
VTREEQMLEDLISDLIDHPPPGISSDEVGAWLRLHAAELIAAVNRACGERSGHYYEVGGTWYVDGQFLQNLSSRHETLPMRADWEILLPEGALRCRMLQGQTALPGQIGVLYACEPDPALEFPTQLHRWAQEQGLANFEGQWPQWPAAPKGAGCGCQACKVKHAAPGDRANPRKAEYPEEVPKAWVKAFTKLSQDFMNIAEEDGLDVDGINPRQLASDAWRTWLEDGEVHTFDDLEEAFENTAAPEEFYQLTSELIDVVWRWKARSRTPVGAAHGTDPSTQSRKCECGA